MGMISQDHSKLDSDTIVEAMKLLVESNLSIKARFNYTISYRKAWLTKQKSIAKVLVDEKNLTKNSRSCICKSLWSTTRGCKNEERHMPVGATTSNYFSRGTSWGHVMTNLIECINSVLKGVQNLSVLELVRVTYYRLNDLFTGKSKEAHQHKRAGFTYSEFATQRIEANM
ncbi:hypothetical protein Ahy_B05g076200 [Arachis hypogaea]|uniref:Uncharacterized protein n=1 Tax=Arachis hypogaea TaxID=3818 RepID=A0A444Z2T7_ARAHY|nr:hypothetical protein Ahy_B05g076200 [Arachis hypogaea]